MIRNSFNADWTVGPRTTYFAELTPGNQPPKSVTLPHDAMWENKRLEEGESNIACYPDGVYEYRKKFFIPAEYRDKRVTIEFEGVYNQAMVYINGDFACQHPFGYSQFYVKADRFLKYGEENEIKVVAVTHKDSRWYSGAGIYRNTKLIVGNLTHIALDGVKVSTPEIHDDRALVSVATVIENEGLGTLTAKVLTEIVDAHGTVVARDEAPITTFAGESATLRQRMLVQTPKLWSVDHPNLYICRTTVTAGENLLDEESTNFGIRSLTLDTEQGLCINGESIKLRGACIHHDNGVIGAVTFDRAEERRVEILKEAGFNALRSSHHPMSKAMLDACDRLGMLVMDESFDMWTSTKSEYDYAMHFPLWWEKDIQAMVDKDYNHPSVIMYSIGNEIPETGSSIGATWGRKLAEKIRSLDSTRFVTNSVNFMLAIMSDIAKQTAEAQSQGGEAGGINTMMNDLGDYMSQIVASDLSTTKTAESFAYVDIAGYNYGESRYLMDKELFSNRIIVGSETFANRIDKNWKLVKENTHLIGDFTWTGWDYLGEAGVGRVHYDLDGPSTYIQSTYPWITAWVGDIDIIGDRRPSSYYREIVFGLRKEPYIAVQRPEHYSKKATLSSWGWSDSISSWSWNGHEGEPIKVEVYADAEEVELLVNGQLVGKAAAGEANGFKAEFDTVYEAGEVTAVAYIGGEETSRTILYSANGTVILKAEADRMEIAASENDLAFVMISLVDGQGSLYNTADRKVSVKVEGPGVLQGLGSAKPDSMEHFFDDEHTTFDGKALAVVRPTGAGTINVTVTAENCASQTVSIRTI
ncbi:glycoside hydrolase family 2 TIM barrel-domain containing protein [Paenibacillus sp. UASWS1643]|uniref:glycoside hydrolase family 2 TIM barrel-domain containing protein n=1 Tax=Paenibacillus sp. UASWS1643 TaxID=2580422 RepID=UPI0012388438|nr:glycoside hydrolase family 2 TIM barrel-domain containing protein [Paenibacillus sp. UASWS1643]KAA8746126.1 glycoside hydrolase family 2 protein [Paenibacillus sp. UASWS1643]